MGKIAIERQVIVDWYKPEEKLPEPYLTVVATISGHRGNCHYDRALALMEYADDGCGWMPTEGEDFDELTVHAWCDLDCFEG